MNQKIYLFLELIKKRLSLILSIELYRYSYLTPFAFIIFFTSKEGTEFILRFSFVTITFIFLKLAKTIFLSFSLLKVIDNRNTSIYVLDNTKLYCSFSMFSINIEQNSLQ